MSAKLRTPRRTGLISLAFQQGSPYQGEDLFYDFENPERFFVRCTRDGPALTPGICLSERRLGQADITIRFPRDWLSDWHAVAGRNRPPD